MYICIELPLRWYNKSYLSYTHIWLTHQILNVLLTDVISCSVDRTDEMRRGGCGTHPTRSNIRPHIGLRGHTVTSPPRTSADWGDHGRWWPRDNPWGVLRSHHLFRGFDSPPPGPGGPHSLISISRTFSFLFGRMSFTFDFFHTFLEGV